MKKSINGRLWMCCGLMLASLAGCGGSGGSMTITTPVMVPGPGGSMAPMTNAKGEVVTQTTTIPESAVPAWAQTQMAQQRKPYATLELDDQGKPKKWEIWGENGRASYVDVDPVGVKYAKYLAAPLAGVAGAGIAGYFGVENNRVVWGAMGSALARWGQPTTVNIDHGQYVGGNSSGGGWALSPTTTTTTTTTEGQ